MRKTEGLYMKRPITFLVFCFLFLGFFASPSLAATTTTTVNWSGPNNFDDAFISVTPFKADHLTDIIGAGLYEGANNYKPTTFNLWVALDSQSHWVDILDWSLPKWSDNTQVKLDPLVPPAIDLHGVHTIFGIGLSSSPDGGSSDPNFTNFAFKTYYTRDEYYQRYRYLYKDWDDFVRCGDYEKYVKTVTQFVFSFTTTTDNTPPSAVPLPGAVLLMGTMLAATGGLAGWRRATVYRRRRG